MTYALFSLAAVFVCFIAVLIIKALAFNPKNDVKVIEGEEVFDKDVVITRLAELVKCKSDFDLYFVFTVKKNIGMKGAKVAAFDIKPDYAVVLDAVSADKPSVIAKDKNYIVDNTLKEKLCACGFDIIVNKELMTEASAIQVTGDGVKTAAVGINVKYINNANEVCKVNDINNTIIYLKKFFEKEF